MIISEIDSDDDDDEGSPRVQCTCYALEWAAKNNRRDRRSWRLVWRADATSDGRQKLFHFERGLAVCLTLRALCLNNESPAGGWQ